MKQVFTLLIMVFFCNHLISQVKFQEGYIVINNSKTECLIQNDNWYKTPKKINYKLNNNSEVLTIESENLDELYINDTDHKYVNSKILKTVENDNYTSENKLLKILLTGEASLYYHESEKDKKFYFNVNNDSNIYELTFNEININNSLKKDYGYKHQLFSKLKCHTLNVNDFKNLEYAKNDLLKIFKNFNTCKGHDIIDYTKNEAKGKFYFSLNIGTSIATSKKGEVENDGDNYTHFTNPFKTGIEVEYRFAHLRNKYAFFSGISYSKYSFEGKGIESISTPIPSNPDLYSLNKYSYESEFNLIELPIGFRYYSHINSKNSLFYNLGLTYNIVMNNDNELIINNSLIENSTSKLDLQNNLGWFIGVGYKYNNRYSLHVTYNTVNEVTNLRAAKNKVDIKNISFMVSYRFF